MALLIFIFHRYYAAQVTRSKKEQEVYLHQLEDSVEEIERLEAGWKLDWTCLSLGKKLASGAYGDVCRAILNDTLTVAVKTLRDTDQINLFEDAEIRLLQRARHPRLVMFVGAGYIDNDENKGIFVVMEYMNYGSLTSFLHNNSRRLEEKIPLLKDVAEGMAFLHSVCKVLHRDLKSDNCLLVKNPKTGKIRCKVGDFGLSRFSQPQTSRSKLLSTSSSFSTQESSSKTRRSSLKERMGSTWCSSAKRENFNRIS